MIRIDHRRPWAPLFLMLLMLVVAGGGCAVAKRGGGPPPADPSSPTAHNSQLQVGAGTFQGADSGDLYGVWLNGRKTFGDRRHQFGVTIPRLYNEKTGDIGMGDVGLGYSVHLKTTKSPGIGKWNLAGGLTLPTGSFDKGLGQDEWRFRVSLRRCFEQGGTLELTPGLGYGHTLDQDDPNELRITTTAAVRNRTGYIWFTPGYVLGGTRQGMTLALQPVLPLGDGRTQVGAFCKHDFASDEWTARLFFTILR